MLETGITTEFENDRGDYNESVTGRASEGCEFESDRCGKILSQVEPVRAATLKLNNKKM